MDWVMSDETKTQLDQIVKYTIPVAALLMAVATWNFTAALDRISANDKKIHALEMFEAEVRGNRFTSHDAAKMQQAFVQSLNSISQQQAVTQQVLSQMQGDINELCKQQTDRWNDGNK